MEEQDYLLIDNFFDGLLSETARQEVLQRVDKEPTFAAAFATTQKMQEWLRREPRRKVFEQTTAALGQSFFTEEKEENLATKSVKTIPVNNPVMGSRPGGLMKRGNIWAIAAAIALLVAAVWFVMRPQPPLYQQFALHTPPQFTERSGAFTAATTAETSFKKGDYATALTALQQLAQQRPDDPTVAFYSGVCQLELQQTNAARAVFTTLANGVSVWREEAQWYVALTYLRENDLEKCKQVLGTIQPDAERYKSAVRLLKKL